MSNQEKKKTYGLFCGYATVTVPTQPTAVSDAGYVTFEADVFQESRNEQYLPFHASRAHITFPPSQTDAIKEAMSNGGKLFCRLQVSFFSGKAQVNAFVVEKKESNGGSSSTGLWA